MVSDFLGFWQSITALKNNIPILPLPQALESELGLMFWLLLYQDKSNVRITTPPNHQSNLKEKNKSHSQNQPQK